MAKEPTTTEVTVPKESVKEVSIFEKSADDLKITNNTDMETAADLLGSVKKMQKSLKTKEDDAKRPFQDTLNGIRAAYKPINADLSAAESTIKGKVVDYRKKEAAAAEEKKNKIEARVGEGKGKLKVQTAINQISNVDQGKSEAHIDTGSSSMTVRMIKKVRITDESLVPRDYLVVDTTKVKAAAVKIHDLKKEGVAVEQIPGVEVYEEESIGAR